VQVVFCEIQGRAIRPEVLQTAVRKEMVELAPEAPGYFSLRGVPKDIQASPTAYDGITEESDVLKKMLGDSHKNDSRSTIC
jgi:hypothetical protein